MVCNSFLPSFENLKIALRPSSTTQTFFSGSYGLMKTACGCLNSLSHCVQDSTMSPSAFTMTRQCSQRPSTPYLPFQLFATSSGPGGLDTGPCPAFRNGSPLTGKERLGPNSG